MRCPAKKWGLQGMLLLIVWGGALPVHAQTLDVCNKGTVTVEVVVAKNASLFFSYWAIEGTPVAPRACERVYDEGNSEYSEQYPAYIGFGFADSHGQWGAGTVDSGILSQTPIVKKGEQILCVRQDQTYYRTKGDQLPQNCATEGFPNNVGHGPYVALAAAMYFQPKRGHYEREPISGLREWVGGDYHLNIAPDATARDLHATVGTESGEDAKEDVDGGKLLKKLGDWMDAIRRKNLELDRAAAEAERRKRAEAEAARQKRLEIAAANGDPNAKLSLELAARLDAGARQKWSGPRFSPGGYVPRWMDENIVLRGTVARVDLNTQGFPPWLTVFFKESPDSTFVVCSPHPDLFQEKFGNDFSGLIGKTIEVMGQVEAPYCAGRTASIRVVEANQFRLAGAEQPNVNAAGNQPVFAGRIRPAELTSDDYRKANSLPMMIGKVNVKMFGGLDLGEPPARASKIYGQPAADRITEQVYGPHGGLTIAYTHRNAGVPIVRRVTVNSSELSWVRAHLTAFGVPRDSLLELIGQDESAAIALLGPPQKRESQDAQTHNLYWTFETAGYPAGDANATSNQTVALGFKAGLGCSSVSVTW